MLRARARHPPWGEPGLGSLRVWSLRAALALTLAVVGCAGFLGASASASAGANVGLSSAELRSALAAAVASASAVHITGAMVAGGQEITVDLHLNKDGSSVGTVSIGDVVQPVKAVGGVYYAQITGSYIRYRVAHGGNAALYAPVTGMWASSLAGPGSLAAHYAPLLSYSLFFDQVMAVKSPFVVRAAGVTTIDGRSVAVYTDASGSRLYVAASGPAYPLRNDGAAANYSGTLSFSWNQPVMVAAPAPLDIIPSS